MREKPEIYYRSFNFAIELIGEIKNLPSLSIYTEPRRQVSRSSMSISANIIEAQNARSRIEFISGNKIALREAEETLHWIKILIELKKEEDKNSRLHYFVRENQEIINVVASIAISAQKNLERIKQMNIKNKK